MYQPTNYIPSNLKIDSWSDIEPYFRQLLADPADTVADLQDLILHYSEVLSVLHEQQARAYIAMTCHTDNEEYRERFELFSTKITPEAEPLCDQIQRKCKESPAFGQLDKERYEQLKRDLLRELEMFRAENVPLDAQVRQMSATYGQVVGGLMAKIDGVEITLPAATAKLESEDRLERQKAWLAIFEARFGIKEKLDDLFDQMLLIRNQIAINTGYSNYRDYTHDNLQRFDFTVQDVLTFHDSIEKHVMPLVKKVISAIPERLNLEPSDFRPWDVAGQPKGFKPLKPFSDANDFLQKTFKIFKKIKPAFADNLQAMNKAGLFDLETRKHKSPGGYNYGLEITGMPFIFMNAAGTHRDVITLMHEGGHAMQSFLLNNEPLLNYRNPPAEIAEVASMSMELITSLYWDEFYNEVDGRRARRDHLEDIIDVFPWVATIDAFQHWVYTHPQHSHEERDAFFEGLMGRFGTGLINWTGYEHFRRNHWQKQLHVFELPFYYIEYAISQVGALQVYRNYVENPREGLDAFVAGLTLGASKSVPEVWSTMGIQFDFSASNLQSLMAFVEKEWEKVSDL